MVDFSSYPKQKPEPKVLGASSTRAQLIRMWDKSFDPESWGAELFHPSETARFIAEQARKMRLAAIKSGQVSMVWMIENLYYEAYALGCATSLQDRGKKDPPRAKGN